MATETRPLLVLPPRFEYRYSTGNNTLYVLDTVTRGFAFLSVLTDGTSVPNNGIGVLRPDGSRNLVNTNWRPSSMYPQRIAFDPNPPHEELIRINFYPSRAEYYFALENYEGAHPGNPAIRQALQFEHASRFPGAMMVPPPSSGAMMVPPPPSGVTGGAGAPSFPTTSAAATNAPLVGLKRGRESNLTNIPNPRNIKRPPTGPSATGPPIRVFGPFEKMGEEQTRDHVTVVIHNTINNTFLVGEGNKYLNEGVPFEDHRIVGSNNINMDSYKTALVSYLIPIGLTAIDINNALHNISGAHEYNEELKNTILNAISTLINQRNLQLEKHVKYYDHEGKTYLVIMVPKDYGKYLGFPKGGIENMDVVEGNYLQTIKNAARREVLEETLHTFGTENIRYVGKIAPAIRGRVSYSNICYIPVTTAIDTQIINNFNQNQVRSELFNLRFVDCNALRRMFHILNEHSVEVVLHLTGTPRIFINNEMNIPTHDLPKFCDVTGGAGSGYGGGAGGRYGGGVGQGGGRRRRKTHKRSYKTRKSHKRSYKSRTRKH